MSILRGILPGLEEIEERGKWRSKQNISFDWDKNIMCRKCRTLTIKGEKCRVCGWKNE
jgi:RNase P subunit RPR2